MALALTQWLKHHSARQIVFIGYSGGGTLATLLVEHFPQTRAVVTIAGNLDVKAWTEYHNYEPLFLSINGEFNS